MAKKHYGLLWNSAEDIDRYVTLYCDILDKIYISHFQHENAIKYVLGAEYYEIDPLWKGCAIYQNFQEKEKFHFHDYQILIIDEPKIELKRITKFLCKYTEGKR